MNTTDSLIYEHPLISSDLQRCVGDGKNIFININNQLHWIHENTESQLIITNMETNNNVIEIPITTAFKYNFSKYNVVLYDDNTLWVGRTSLASYDKIWINNNCCKKIPNYNNDVFVIDLVNITYKHLTTDFDIRKLNTIGRMYFTVKTTEELLIFNWSDLLNLNEELVPIHKLHSDVTIYPINWRESVICKTTFDTKDVEFLDENFNVLFTQNVKDLFKDYKPIEDTNENDIIKSIISVNNNCFMYLECRELIDCKYYIIKEGLKHIYCLDLTNNKEIKFENGIIEHFIENVIPYRYNGKVKYIAYEWYPAGNWTKNYDSLN